jgi:predicted DCC family thiol-disulfide oxidoreductase YuxK
MNIVLFDGICNLCNASVRFITRHDRNSRIAFASLQSETAKQLLLKMNIDSQKIDSIIFISNEKMFIKSDAAIEIAKQLNGFPHYLKFFQVIPRPIRDFVYDLITKNRYRFFGKVCSLEHSNQNK